MTAAMDIALAMGGAAAACCAWPVRPDPGRRLLALASRPRVHEPAAARGVRRPLVILAGVSVPAALVVGMPWWVLGLAVVGLGALAARQSRRPTYAELPLVLDLLASCLLAGAPLSAALAAAAATGGADLRSRLTTVATALSDGVAPARAWAVCTADDQLAPVARCCLRVTGSGAAVAAEMTRLAARQRARRRADVQDRAARVTTWIVLPLGLCFLPAFVLVGVVPLALGLLHSVL